MTLTLEVAPEVEQSLQEQARNNNQSVAEYATAMLAYAARVHPSITDVSRRLEIAARLAALDALTAYAESLPDRRAEAGLPPLDLSGARADVYGYTEREDAQL